jgi:hypothetical protein
MPLPEWSRIVNSTMHEYTREEEVNILRNRKILAKLKAAGRISFGHSGDMMDWKVRYKRAPMQGYADGDVLVFQRRDKRKTAQLEWRGYSATDAVSKKERLMNKSTEAIINIFSNTGKELMEDIEESFGDEVYIDGNGSGNSKRMHGIESIFSGATAGSSATAPVGVNANTNYAGLSTVLQAYGGTWTGTWPDGYGDSNYDFWTPLIVDYTSAITTANGGWAASTKTWPNTCKEALRYGILAGQRNKSKKTAMDLISLTNVLYRQFLNLLDSSERLVVNRGDAQSLVSLGFTDVVNLDGAEITWEYGVPSAVGYGWATQQVELCSLQDTLFAPDGPEWDIGTRQWKFAIDCLGNMKFNPRPFTKWQALGGT